MTTERRFERDLPDLLAELAAGAPPNYRDDIVQRVATTRQRPAWTFPERWLPMAVLSRRPAVASFNVPWRSLAMVALLAALLAVAVGIFVASRPRLPEPYGLAANGMLAYTADGDVLVKDSLDAPGRVLIGGPEEDIAAQFSRRGDTIYFLRIEGTRASLMAAELDGTNIRPVATGVRNFMDGKVSPNGDLLAVGATGADEMSEITIYTTGETAPPRTLDLGLLSAENPHWRPGTADELAFRGLELGRGFGLYLVKADGSNLRRLDLESERLMSGQFDFHNIAWSPDGSRLAFHSLDALDVAPDGNGFRIRIADINAAGAVTGAQVLEFDPEADDESSVAWAPTGDAIAYQRREGVTDTLHIAPVDGGPSRQLGGPASTDPDGQGTFFEFSPDGRTLLATFNTEGTVWAYDVATGAATPIDIPGFESWQRVLP